MLPVGGANRRACKQTVMPFSDRAACDFINQRLSGVTQVDGGDEAPLVVWCACVCERKGDSVRTDKGTAGKEGRCDSLAK